MPDTLKAQQGFVYDHIQTAVQIGLPVHQLIGKTFQLFNDVFRCAKKSIQCREKIIIQQPDIFLPQFQNPVLRFMSFLNSIIRIRSNAAIETGKLRNFPSVCKILLLIEFHTIAFFHLLVHQLSSFCRICIRIPISSGFAI